MSQRDIPQPAPDETPADPPTRTEAGDLTFNPLPTSEDDAVLGRLSDAEADTSLSTPPAPQSHRKTEPPVPLPTSGRRARAGGTPWAGRDTEILALPRRALVVLRKSGGLRFSSRELTVYSNGRIGYRRVETNPRAHRRMVARLSAPETAHIKRMVDQLGQVDARFGVAHGGDAFAYEIVGRVGRGLKAVEVVDGAIPVRLAPLLYRLQELMPED